jgi:hypothetical protein
MDPHRSSFDLAYIRRRADFVPFAASCFGTLCEFVRVHFDDLLEQCCWVTSRYHVCCLLDGLARLAFESPPRRELRRIACRTGDDVVINLTSE